MGSPYLLRLLESFSKHLGTMSGFNAAEGSWGREAVAREVCKRKLKKHSKVLMGLYGCTIDDLKVQAQGQLVSTSDYIER